MAIISNTPASSEDGSPDLSLTELAQLLSRLKQSVLYPSPERERRLRTSEYERTRVEMNLRFAQAALAKLEQTGRRTDTQQDLATQRDVLELLFDRLEDLQKVAEDDEDGGSSDGEDLLGDVIHTPPSESLDSSRTSDAQREGFVDDGTPEPEPPEPPAEPEATTPEPPANDTHPIETQVAFAEPLTQTTQSLRARPSATSAPSSSSSPSAHSTARAALFANRRKPPSPQTTTATAEAILDHQRAEQDAISDSILKMAGALKESSKGFSATLEADKDLLGAAGTSMEKSELGMEAARGRIGSLRKMTEGKGWWGRMILYAWVYGLMLALVLLVFVLPKLRF